MSTKAFLYFIQYKDEEQSLTYPEKLVETVSSSVTVLEAMRAEVAHSYSVEEKITAAIKNTIDFGWFWSSGCSPRDSGWYCEKYYKNILSLVVQVEKQIIDGSK
jgi:hypothetical protein